MKVPKFKVLMMVVSLIAASDGGASVNGIRLLRVQGSNAEVKTKIELVSKGGLGPILNLRGRLTLLNTYSQEDVTLRVQGTASVAREFARCHASAPELKQLVEDDVLTRLVWFNGLVRSAFGTQQALQVDVILIPSAQNVRHKLSLRAERPDLTIVTMARYDDADCHQTYINIVSAAAFGPAHELLHVIARYGSPYRRSGYPNIISEEAHAHLSGICLGLLHGNIRRLQAVSGMQIDPEWAWDHRGMDSAAIHTAVSARFPGVAEIQKSGMRGAVLAGVSLIELLGPQSELEPDRDRPKLERFCRAVLFDDRVDWLQQRPCLHVRFADQCAWNKSREKAD